MKRVKPDVSVPPIALDRTNAAAALGMSPESFDRHVKPHLRLIRRGSMLLVPVAELERWATESAEMTMPVTGGIERRAA